MSVKLKNLKNLRALEFGFQGVESALRASSLHLTPRAGLGDMISEFSCTPKPEALNLSEPKDDPRALKYSESTS